MDEKDKSGIVILDAPAGYGKTSLLVQIYDYFQQHGASACWVTLDQEDRLAHAFVENISAAITLSGAEIDDNQNYSESPINFMIDVLDQLANIGRDFVLIFDNCHAGISEDVDHVFDIIFKHKPDNVFLIFAARGRISRKFTAIELSGAARRFGAEQLKLTIEDIKRDFGNEISDSQAEHLLIKTEGWPASLHFLNSHYINPEKSKRAIADLPGGTSEIMSYLVEAVFHDLPHDIRDFLMDASILARLNGDLINFMTDGSNGWIIMEQAIEQSLFLSVADASGQWFRFHPLFADFLLNRLRREKPGREKLLRQKAAKWLILNDFFTDGVRQAALSDDMHFVAELLEESDCTNLVMSVGTECLGALEKMEVGELMQFPNVAVSMVYKFAQDGRIEKARQLNNRLYASLSLYGDNDAVEKYRAQHRIYDGLIQIYCDKLPEVADYEEDFAVEIESKEEMEMNILCGLGEIHNNDLHSASRRAKKIAQNMSYINLPYLEQFGYNFCILISSNSGEFRSAEDLYEKCIRAGETHSQNQSIPLNIASLFLSEIYYEQGEWGNAEKIFPLSDVYFATDGFDWFEIFLSTCTSLIPRLTHLYGLDRSFDVLAGLDRHASHHGLERLKSLIPIIRFREALRSNDLTQARACLGDVDMISLADGQIAQSPYSRHHFLALHAKFHLDFADARLAGWRETLAEAARHCARGGWVRWHVRFLIARAMCEHAAGDRIAADALMTQALRIAEPISLITPFVEFPTIVAFVTSAESAGADWRRVSADFLAGRLEAPLPGADPAAACAVTGRGCTISLSPRENAVLRLIAEGMTGKEIARALNISVGTAKGYRKTLFQKLGANNRYGAIQAARADNLL